MYTNASFAALMAFLKPRIVVKWDQIFDELIKDQFAEAYQVAPELRDTAVQLYFWGVKELPPFLVQQEPLPVGSERGSVGVLTLDTRPNVSCVVITIPRERLVPIYREIFHNESRSSFHFEVRVEFRVRNRVDKFRYSTSVALFGKLVIEVDGLSGRIEVDTTSWNGDSDLQVCVYIPTNGLYDPEFKRGPQHTHISFVLCRGPGANSSNGLESEIFKANLLDSNHVHVLTHLEGIENPLPAITVSALLDTLVSDEHVRFGPTYLLVPEKEAMFGRRATIENQHDLENFKSGAKITVEQHSPCTATVRYADSSHIFRFPFPVSDRAPLLRVSKKKGWFELVVLLSDIRGKFQGGYQDLNLFPLIRTRVNGPSSWSLPLINFPALESFDYTFAAQYVDFALRQCINETPVSRLVKVFWYLGVFTFLTTSGPNPPPIGIAVEGNPRALIFVTTLFYDDEAHSPAAEAFYCSTPPAYEKFKALNPKMWMLDLPAVSANVFESLHLSIPAMAERCRDWEHTRTCAYLGDFAPGQICSCGIGKVNSRFRTRPEWAEFEGSVVRFALTPVFPVPFVERTRLVRSVGESQQAQPRGPAQTWMEFMRLLAMPGSMGPQAASQSRGPEQPLSSGQGVPCIQEEEEKVCEKCGAGGKLKKCARCEKAYYCGGKCQKEDWKRHKPECRAKR
jgi:MYND finger